MVLRVFESLEVVIESDSEGIVSSCGIDFFLFFGEAGILPLSESA